MEGAAIIDPRIALPILVILSLGDLLLGRASARVSLKYRSKFFEYEATESSKDRSMSKIGFMNILLKLIPAFLVLLIWAATISSKSQTSASLYQAILGFSLALFLIIDLRHIESLFLGLLARKRQDDINGKLIIKKGYSLGQSSVQFFTLFIVLTVVALLQFRPFFIAAALAPLSLIIRNMILMRS